MVNRSSPELTSARRVDLFRRSPVGTAASRCRRSSPLTICRHRMEWLPSLYSALSASTPEEDSTRQIRKKIKIEVSVRSYRDLSSQPIQAIDEPQNRCFLHS
ncbi:unnamed protein product [Cuscuta europaea]|uniref:Uncharacterized protein n=1 Tax=Cuscuta europaea TaxID=41803 RepID=A0A9P0ZH15_CUSEU|nr:unnamed protein product [Cuscuta europaea]